MSLQHKKNIKTYTSKIPRQVKVLASKPEYLSLILGMCMVEDESQLPQVIL